MYLLKALLFHQNRKGTKKISFFKHLTFLKGFHEKPGGQGSGGARRNRVAPVQRPFFTRPCQVRI